MSTLQFVTIPIYIASFVVLGYQYYHADADKPVISLHFGLMVAVLISMFAAIFLVGDELALIFFAMAVVWLALSLYLLYRLLRLPGE